MVAHAWNAVSRAKLAKLDSRVLVQFVLTQEADAFVFREAASQVLVVYSPHEHLARVAACHNQALVVQCQRVKLFVANARSEIFRRQLD